MPKTNTKTSKTTKTKTARTTQKVTNRPATTHIAREVIIPEEYEPIGMWGYFGYTFLFAIPVIGWIICICLAIGGRNLNLRNFARSQFCWLIIYIVAVCLLASFGVLTTVFQSFGLI